MNSFITYSKRYLGPYLVGAVVLLLLLDYAACTIVLSRDCESGMSKMYKLFNKQDDFKYPILGSSRARCTFIPSEMGAGFYNFGMDGSSASVHFEVANALAKTGKYPLIVLNFDPDYWISVGDLNNYLPVINEPAIRKIIDDTTFHASYEPWQSVAGLRFAFNYEYILKDYLKDLASYQDSTRAGYTYYNSRTLVDTSSFEQFRLKHQEPIKRLDFRDKQDRYFSKLLKDNPQQRFAIVFTPAYHKFDKPIVSDTAIARHRLSFYNLPNVTVFNCYEFDLPRDCFHDPLHVNMKGAARFSRAIADSLKAHKLL